MVPPTNVTRRLKPHLNYYIKGQGTGLSNYDVSLTMDRAMDNTSTATYEGGGNCQ